MAFAFRATYATAYLHTTYKIFSNVFLGIFYILA